MAYGDPGAGGDLSDWGGGTSGGGGPDPWDPDPEDYRPRASRTPTDYEAEASASTLERFIPPSPPPVDQGVGSLLGDAGQQAKSWWERTWGPNPNLKNPLLTGIAAPFEMLLNAGAAALGIPLDAQLFTNQDLRGTETQPPGFRFGVSGFPQLELGTQGANIITAPPGAMGSVIKGIGSLAGRARDALTGNQPLSVDLGGTVKGTGGSDLPTQPGRFGYLGPSPFGPFDLGPRGTMGQGIGTPTTPSGQQMANQAAQTIRQLGYYPNLPAAAGPALAATTGDAANIHATPEEIRAVEVPLMRGSSQVSTPQLEDRTYVRARDDDPDIQPVGPPSLGANRGLTFQNNFGWMTYEDILNFSGGSPEEKARIRAKYQR